MTLKNEENLNLILYKKLALNKFLLLFSEILLRDECQEFSILPDHFRDVRQMIHS